MLERCWELQVVSNLLWRNPGSNIKASFMLLSTLHILSDNDVTENVISWLFHSASKFQQTHKEYFFNHLWMWKGIWKEVSDTSLMHYRSVKSLITDAIKWI